jgi:Ran GTPase-activating protein (RanGAP) involved in mRNA processing and transport
MGARLLASALSLKNSSLKRINLAANGITDEGAQCLAEMLMTNKTLVELGLSFNQIGDRGVELLANALAHYNSSLEELTLFSNKLISDLSVDPLIEMLTHNRTLKEFWLSDCNLSTTGKAKLRKSGKSKENFELCL